MTEKKPRLLVMGEEVDWNDAPEADASHLGDYFKPPRLSPQAIDAASKIVPRELWVSEGLHTWLSKQATQVFMRLNSSETVGRGGKAKYVFAYDAQGPVLEKFLLG